MSNYHNMSAAMPLLTAYRNFAEKLDKIDRLYAGFFIEIHSFTQHVEKIIDKILYEQRLAQRYPHIDSIESRKRRIWLREVIEQEEALEELQLLYFMQLCLQEEQDLAELKENQQWESNKQQEYALQLVQDREHMLKQMLLLQQCYARYILQLAEQNKEIYDQIQRLEFLREKLLLDLQQHQQALDYWLNAALRKCAASSGYWQVSLPESTHVKVYLSEVYQALALNFSEKFSSGEVSMANIMRDSRAIIENVIWENIFSANSTLRKSHCRKEVSVSVAEIHQRVKIELRQQADFKKVETHLQTVITEVKTLAYVDTSLEAMKSVLSHEQRLRDQMQTQTKIVTSYLNDEVFSADDFALALDQAKWLSILAENSPQHVESVQSIAASAERSLTLLAQAPTLSFADEEPLLPSLV